VETNLGGQLLKRLQALAVRVLVVLRRECFDLAGSARWGSAGGSGDAELARYGEDLTSALLSWPLVLHSR
jgi:hypothetical protein